MEAAQGLSHGSSGVLTSDRVWPCPGLEAGGRDARGKMYILPPIHLISGCPG